MLSATSSASRAPAPSMPLCWPSTQTSQTTVANIGKAISWRKVSIQAPGRGSSARHGRHPAGGQVGQGHAEAERGEHQQRLRRRQADREARATRP